MTQPGNPPSVTDAATLTLAACVLMASEYPKSATPDQAQALAVQTVDVVMAIWTEIGSRIGSGVLISPRE